MKRYLSSFTRNLINSIGSKVEQKIVVIESDDWGTIRMSSKGAYQALLKKGYPVDKCPYNSNDCLESNSDLENLFELLSSIKGSDGNPAVMTANNIVANPDFDKIRESRFTQYFYEPFTETLKGYPEHNRVESLYKEGITNNVFIPQFHGREHVNFRRWIKLLKSGEKWAHDAFAHNMFSIHLGPNPKYKNEMMDALDFDAYEEIEVIKSTITDGLKIFESLWGFKSKTFIAPCYIWHPDIEQTLRSYNVEGLQGIINQLIPFNKIPQSYKKKINFSGKFNQFGLRYSVRNVFFEPVTDPVFDWLDDALTRIRVAFRWQKPAIISSHRLNYIRGINENNSGNGLIKLKQLLHLIKKNWPDVIFMSSNQLLDKMKVINGNA